jgi:hypothetical protein
VSVKRGIQGIRRSFNAFLKVFRIKGGVPLNKVPYALGLINRDTDVTTFEIVMRIVGERKTGDSRYPKKF